MSEMVTVISTRLLTLTLTHEEYCIPLGECHCKSHAFKRAIHNPTTGYTGVARKQKSFPPEITVPAMVRTKIPKASLACPQVAAARKARDLRVLSSFAQ